MILRKVKEGTAALCISCLCVQSALGFVPSTAPGRRRLGISVNQGNNRHWDFSLASSLTEAAPKSRPGPRPPYGDGGGYRSYGGERRAWPTGDRGSSDGRRSWQRNDGPENVLLLKQAKLVVRKSAARPTRPPLRIDDRRPRDQRPRSRGDGVSNGPPAIMPAVPEPPMSEAQRRKKEKDKDKEKKGKYSEDAESGRAGKWKAKTKGAFDDTELDEDFDTARSAKFRKQKRRGSQMEEETEKSTVVVIDEPTLTVGQLAEKMNERAGEVIKYLMVSMGVMATVTQFLDSETAIKVAEAFGKQVSRERTDPVVGAPEEPSVLTEGLGFDEDDTSTLLPRPPVVTVMGHVDHGKTSLLDAIRETSVVSGEAGGITQHIGAYQVACPNDQKITFIDTPGHAAFSEMRARGANVTDLVVLVVAADEGIKNQTIDSVRCAKQAGVPILVAINKIDKPGADPQRVISDLTGLDVLMEEYGGDVLSAQVSAKKRINLNGLLEKILLQAEILELKANPDRAAQGTVIDTRVEKGLGPVTTVLVQRGTLKVGDNIVAGTSYGKVRSLTDVRNKRIASAEPSVPAVVSGWDGIPDAGDILVVVKSEAQARDVAEARRRIARERSGAALLGSMQAQASAIFTADGVKRRTELTVVIKADVHGSAEAIARAISAIKAEDDRAEVVVKVLSSGVGDVSQSDISLASVSHATVLAFNVAADMQAQDEARNRGVDIQYHSIIYEILDDLQERVQQTLSPTPDGELVGSAEIKQVFEIGKVGKVAGCNVNNGMVKRGGIVRILRGSDILFKGTLKTLRNVKADVTEMQAGQECGMSFAGFEQMQAGDVVECWLPKPKGEKAGAGAR